MESKWISSNTQGRLSKKRNRLILRHLSDSPKNGEDFAALANEHSMDPGNQNTKGGDLGWFKKGRMVKEFDEAAFKAKKGQIIGPIKSNFGFHVIHVRDIRKNEDGDKEVLASHILCLLYTSPSPRDQRGSGMGA